MRKCDRQADTSPPPSLHQSKAAPPSLSFDILFRSRLPAGAPLGSRGPLSRPMQLRRGRLIFSQTSTQDRGIYQSRCRNMRRQRQKCFSPMVYVGMQHFVLFAYENAALWIEIEIQGMQELEFSVAPQTLPTGSASDVKVRRQFGFRRSESFSGMLRYSKKAAKRSLKRKPIGNSFRGKNDAPIPPHFVSRLLNWKP